MNMCVELLWCVPPVPPDLTPVKRVVDFYGTKFQAHKYE